MTTAGPVQWALQQVTDILRTGCRTPEQKLELNNTIKALEAAAGPVRKADLTGSTWRLVATNSASSSGGKLGPFIGPVEQASPVLQACGALWRPVADVPVHRSSHETSKASSVEPTSSHHMHTLPAHSCKQGKMPCYVEPSMLMGL